MSASDATPFYKRVLVTGASGTIGRYVASLADALGYYVVASDKRRSGIATPIRGEVRTADLTDAAACESLVRGCDAVIHTASELSVDATPASLTAVNTDAVVALFEAARRAGVRRFLHVSTAGLYAPTAQPEGLTEDAPLAPRGKFGQSKHGAEIFLKAQSDGPSWTIVRPAPLYGKRGRYFAASLLVIAPILKAVLHRVPHWEGGPDATMVHAEDVARALLFLLPHESAAREVFNVSDGDVLSLGERISITLDAYGIPRSRVLRPSPWLLERLGKSMGRDVTYRVCDRLAVVLWQALAARHGLKPALRPRLDRESMALLYDHMVVDASKLRALGWVPRFGNFAEAWCEVLKWYQAERWVPRYL